MLAGGNMSTILSNNRLIEINLSALPTKIGLSVFAIMLFLIPKSNSSFVNASPAKYFSIISSVVSATHSVIFVRYFLDISLSSFGTSISVLSSFAYPLSAMIL